MPRILAFLLCVSILAAGADSPAAAGSLANPTDCFIDNPNPTLTVGVQASYVVQLLGGNGSYSVTMSYGDGGIPDSQSTSSTTATFAHYFASSGVFAQTATVASAGSSARCTATTTVQ